MDTFGTATENVNALEAVHTRTPRYTAQVNDPKQNHLGNALLENRSRIDFNPANNTISFENTTIDTVFLNDNIPSLNDPILNGLMIIGDTVLSEFDFENLGWLFEHTTYEVVVNGNTVLTADLINPFLFNEEASISSDIHGLADDLLFDSNLVALMDNIVIDNTINSPYLDDLQENVDNEKQRAIAIFSNIVSETDSLTTSGSSEAIMWDDGIRTVPEPSAPLSLLGIGIGGLGLTLKRKLKPSKFTTKETTKVRSPS